MTPVEALAYVIDYSGTHSSLAPGVAIKRAGTAVRDALKRLTSDDALNMRIK